MTLIVATRSHPAIRQQLLQLAHRHGRDSCQHAAEVGLGIEAVALGAGRGGIGTSPWVPRPFPTAVLWRLESGSIRRW